MNSTRIPDPRESTRLCQSSIDRLILGCRGGSAATATRFAGVTLTWLSLCSRHGTQDTQELAHQFMADEALGPRFVRKWRHFAIAIFLSRSYNETAIIAAFKTVTQQRPLWRRVVRGTVKRKCFSRVSRADSYLSKRAHIRRPTRRPSPSYL